MRSATLILSLLAALMCTAQDWDSAYIESLYAHRALAPIEGVWQFPGDGARIAIVEDGSDTYEIYLIESSRLDIKPGLLIGEVSATAKSDTYEGQLKSDRLGKLHKLSAQNVVMTLRPGGSLVIEPYKTGYNISFKRWLSFLFKITVVDNSNKRPHGLDGAKRVYPYNINEHLPVAL